LARFLETLQFKMLFWCSRTIIIINVEECCAA